MRKQDVINHLVQQLTIEGYSPQTVKSYTSALNKFLDYIAHLHLTLFTEKDIQIYLFVCAQQRFSMKYVTASIKFLYKYVLKKSAPEVLDTRFKKPNRLHVVYSQLEIEIQS